MDQKPQLPKYHELLWPIIVVLRNLGGTGTIQELDDGVVREAKLTEVQQQIMHLDTNRSEISYRLAWARTHLSWSLLIENSGRGIWVLTPDGRNCSEVDVLARHKAVRKDLILRRKERKQTALQVIPVEERLFEEFEELPESVVQPSSLTSTEADEWNAWLLQSLWEMKPDAFERLCQHLLRSAGFTKVEVTGRSGDQGLDGLGLLQISLLNFPVFFQCKRYRVAVPPSMVREFRGAMAGRGDKGLLITTGTFTAEARREATRDGAPPLDLIDGQYLCSLLKQYELGVSTRMVEQVTIDADWFKTV